jgi:hypothetical protein
MILKRERKIRAYFLPMSVMYAGQKILVGFTFPELGNTS